MPTALELTAGQVFAGQFRVVKPLAQGGMGAVYVVEQLSTGKKRALKLMLPSAAVVDGTRRFEQEARTSSLIPSEHVVDVIAAGVEGPERVPWLAMELLEGESLEAFLDRVGAVSAQQAHELLSQLAHALAAAHDLGIVHRDLKPENIFLSRSRTSSSEFIVKVLDFGLATVVDPNSKNTAALGSPLWMAPEQTQTDEPISLSTDIWAVGLIVFRMLSGRHYWRAVEGPLFTLMREVVLEPLPPASQRSREVGGAELPDGFDEWFGQCVVRFAAYRFAHARDAWQALEQVLVNAGATPAGARSASRAPRLDGPTERRPTPLVETENINGATGLSASKTLASPELPQARSAPSGRASAPPPHASRAWLYLLLLVPALLGGLVYWLKYWRTPQEVSRSSADLAPMPSPHSAAPGSASGDPLVRPSEALAPEAPASPSASAAPPLAPSTAASSKAPLHVGKRPPGKPTPNNQPTPASKPEKPGSAIPDLL